MPLWASDVIILTVRIIKIKLNVVDSVKQKKKALNHDYKKQKKKYTQNKQRKIINKKRKENARK